MGLRLLLRSDHLVSDATRLFCGPAPQQRNSARGGDAMSNRGVDGAADHRMLRVGSMAATISIHDRDSRYGAIFERRLRHLGIEQVRTPFRAPRANAISERWVKSVRAECLDHLFIFNETGLRRVMASYVSYFNHSRPHRSASARCAIRQRSRLGAPAAKSSRKAFSADCITSIGMRHNGRYFTPFRLVVTPTIAVIDAPVVDPVRVLSILLRCKASRFLNCRDSRYGEPLNPAEPATANALNVGNFQGTQSQHVGRAGDALLLGARFSCAKTE